MARPTIYDEAKRKTTLTLTPTAFKWLEEQKIRLTANSISDAIERMARENIDKK